MKQKKIKILVLPDSFKGTMTSKEVGNIIKKTIEDKIINVEIIRFSIADGGENTVDAFYENLGGHYIEETFTSPNFNKQKFKYLLMGDTAVIEAAQCAGLIFAHTKNPMFTTSYGMGEQILHAVSKNVKNIIIALGGSATNDAGAGMLSALGVKFFDKKQNEFIPVGATLKNINTIESSALIKIKNINFATICDVTNPFYGKNGAAYIYAKQKGASDKEIKLLDKGMKHLAKIVKKHFNYNLQNITGGGAAGGLGATCCVFFNSKVLSGIDMILNVCHFDEHLIDSNFVITGEGKFDAQSLMGKVVNGISKRTIIKKIPLIVFAGKNDIDNKTNFHNYGIEKIYQTSKQNQTFEEIKKNCKQDLKNAVELFVNEYLQD